jgi:hypothetical protein
MSRKNPLIVLLSLLVVAAVTYLWGRSDGYDDKIIALSYAIFATAFGAFIVLLSPTSFELWCKVLVLPVVASVLGIFFSSDVGQSLGISELDIWSRFAPVTLVLLSIIIVVSHTLWARMKKNKE